MTILLRTLATVAALGGACPLAAADRPTLRGDVTVTRDALTLGDLVSNIPDALAATPLFRAPAFGQSGTVQIRRIASAAEGLGIGAIETGGRLQVTITRAARHVGADEIEAALRKRLSKDFGSDPTATGIAFDGAAPVLAVSPDTPGELSVSDLTLDRRSRRLSATVWLGPSATERKAQLRVTGAAIELVEVVVATRSLERGQTVKAADVTIERRPREHVPADATYDGLPLEGRVPRRSLGAGAMVRPADLARPDLVVKGDLVTVVFETAGVSLSLRAKATDTGALGDTVAVVNPTSKKALQAVVIGPGKVSVSAAPPGRLAAAGSGTP